MFKMTCESCGSQFILKEDKVLSCRCPACGSPHIELVDMREKPVAAPVIPYIPASPYRDDTAYHYPYSSGDYYVWTDGTTSANWNFNTTVTYSATSCV